MHRRLVKGILSVRIGLLGMDQPWLAAAGSAGATGAPCTGAGLLRWRRLVTWMTCGQRASLW